MIEHPRSCLVCGPTNAANLGLRRWEEDGVSCGEIVLTPRHEGMPGYAHGGAIAALLDDVLGSAAQLHGYLAVTGRLEITFRAPGVIGRRYELRARVGDVEGRRIPITGEMRGEEGVIAQGDGLWIVVEDRHFDNGRAASAAHRATDAG